MMTSLFSFLERATTPWHAVDALRTRLHDAGFAELSEGDPWNLVPGGRYFVTRGDCALAAFVVGNDPAAGWAIAAAHTDSPGWRLKVKQQKVQPSGVVRIGTEIYGAPIHSTWFDRPLAIAGRVLVASPTGPRSILVQTEALGVFANLAIHYNREINKGQTYDLADHLQFLAALDGAPSLEAYLARLYGFATSDWLGADLFVVNPAVPVPLGNDGLFLSPRIDNLTGCHAVIEALVSLPQEASAQTRLALCFDQEEIGSRTWTGADSSLLNDLMNRVHGLAGGTVEALYRAKAKSFALSVDSAHGQHPNWASQHDEAYAIQLGGGPSLKSSARFSYSTTGPSEARVQLAARNAGVNLQTFVMKSNLTPGGTVGPMTTAWASIPGADVGIPIWAMHSSMETAHVGDQEAMIRLIAQLFR